MFVIFYLKKTKEVIGFREDTSTNPISPDVAFLDYCENNNKDESTINFVELQYQNLSFADGKYLYDQINNEIELNPNYVEPVASTTKVTEPTL